MHSNPSFFFWSLNKVSPIILSWKLLFYQISALVVLISSERTPPNNGEPQLWYISGLIDTWQWFYKNELKFVLWGRWSGDGEEQSQVPVVNDVDQGATWLTLSQHQLSLYLREIKIKFGWVLLIDTYVLIRFGLKYRVINNWLLTIASNSQPRGGRRVVAWPHRHQPAIAFSQTFA